MYIELCRDRAPILTGLGLRRTRPASPGRKLQCGPTKDEEKEFRQIASVLTVAAAASAEMPKNLGLFFRANAATHLASLVERLFGAGNHTGWVPRSVSCCSSLGDYF